MNVIEKIEELGFKVSCGSIVCDKFYPESKPGSEFLFCEYSIVITKPNGEMINLTGQRDRIIKFCKDRKVMETTRAEIQRQAYKLTDGEYYKMIHGYSRKSGEYFEKVASDIGLVNQAYLTEPIDGEPYKEVDVAMNAGAWLIKKDGLHLLQIAVDVPEDILYYQHTFNHEPAMEEIYTAIDMYKMKRAFLGKNKSEIYRCWECGCQLHWTDRVGSMQDKMYGYEEKYCGC